MSLGKIEKQPDSRDFSWSFWPLVPIYPYGKRRTIRREIIPDRVWTFEQVQGIFYVIVPIRMTVVRLDEGGLLVYAPVAPTGECLQLLKELVVKYGDVKYIILPTISGLEHKVFVAPFARKFPQAQIFVAPDQWSFPFDLPLNWLGFPRKRTFILPEDSSKTPFANQFDYAILKTVDLKSGYFSEVAFFDKKSSTLLVTDSIISVFAEPPLILQIDSSPLLFHAKDNGLETINDTLENRCKGWQRIALFAMYFQPTVLSIPQWGKVFLDAFKAPDKSSKNYFGLFPFKWREDWQQCFYSLSGNGRLFVPPILQTLILNRSPQDVLQWADAIADWDFQRIIPCHFSAPIIAGSQQFRQAFSFLEPSTGSFSTKTYPLPEVEFQVLQEIDKLLCKSRLVPPPKEG
ncbi:conserved hypothetical protein [Hyella patelloides LEGE 07179]|uniref:DUF4336 domain-containing protein n=1 Tax=Hyella patelloides LEGE 07179 TaxID=945734 RepID=A0A563VKM1_9CYAN|nr:DUF4336 domain-containing protein [Hyella patelloides]VEP11962.1 conserved hypothetical protein [Hyella patelloides LEGE 07179]